MKRTLAATALLLAATVSPASAATAPTFSGSCSLRGTDVFTPPLTMTPRPGGAVADVSGTCSGTVTSARGTSTRLTGAPARWILRTTSPSISCAGGTLRGTATLDVAHTTIAMNVVEPQLATTTVLNITGPTTGKALGVASADGRTDILGTTLACAGAGVTSVPITVVFTTLSPVG